MTEHERDQRIRDLEATVQTLQANEVDLNGRRFANAGRSVQAKDYVTRIELDELRSLVPESSDPPAEAVLTTGKRFPKVIITGKDGIQIYDSTGVLVATFNGTSLTITGGTITGGTITGTSFKTGSSGDRVEIDPTNGIRIYDSGDNLLVQIKASVYAGILVNGLRAPDASDIFLESADQSAQLFVSSASDKVSFVAGSVARGHFDDQDGSGAGDQPTSLVLRVNGALKRVTLNSATGFLYLT